MAAARRVPAPRSGLATIRKLRIDPLNAAEFIELPAFARLREAYLDDARLRDLQFELLRDPLLGDLIPGAGGLRKLRFPDCRRGKGKRGGLRVIYFWWERGAQFWLFALYDKDEASDLTPVECRLLRDMLRVELDARRQR